MSKVTEAAVASPRLIALGEERREEIVRFIRSYLAEYGISPSMAEIADHLQVQSYAARRHVKTLIEEGRLTQVPGAARSLRPVKRKRKAS